MDQNNSCPAAHENTCLVLYLYIIAAGHMLLQICQQTKNLEFEALPLPLLSHMCLNYYSHEEKSNQVLSTYKAKIKQSLLYPIYQWNINIFVCVYIYIYIYIVYVYYICILVYIYVYTNENTEEREIPCYLKGQRDLIVQLLCHVQLFVTPWTITRQAPLSMGFSRQECWTGQPFPSPGIFLTQGSNPCFLHWQADSSLLNHQESTRKLTCSLDR